MKRREQSRTIVSRVVANPWMRAHRAVLVFYLGARRHQFQPPAVCNYAQCIIQGHDKISRRLHQALSLLCCQV